MIHSRVIAKILPRDAHFPFYVLFFLAATLATCATVERKNAAVPLNAVVAYCLHLKLSPERILSTAVLFAYGLVVAKNPQKAPFETASPARRAVWTWVFTLPTCVHNLSAVEDFENATPGLWNVFFSIACAATLRFLIRDFEDGLEVRASGCTRDSR